MVMIANLQYGWTFFVPDIQKKFGWDRASIQIAFTLLVLFETWLVPIEGWFVDKFGPRVVIFFGGVLCAIGWIMNSYATTLTEYYIAQIIAGIGAGAVYGTCIGNALKWFPGRRGLAAGLTAAGFGAGSALTVVPIQNMIKSSGFQIDVFEFRTRAGDHHLHPRLRHVCAKARAGARRSGHRGGDSSRRQFAPGELIGPSAAWLFSAVVALVGGLVMWWMGQQFYIPLALAILIFVIGGTIVWTKGQPIFTLMYLMFVIVGAGGLMVTANLAPIAQDLKNAAIPVTVLGLTMPALTFAATLDRILNGLTRPFFGWISDHIGRENTMFIAFGLEGVGIVLAVSSRCRSVLVRHPQRLGVLRLGRDLQFVPINLHGHVWLEIRHDQRRPAVYGEGNGRVAGAVLQLDPEGHGQLRTPCSSSRRRRTSSRRFSRSQC